MAKEDLPLLGGALNSLLLLLREVTHEMGDLCHTSTRRDWETITTRFEHEGESFLTITLPTFASDLQKALAQGYVDHDLFKGFSFAGGLPRFLGGFLDLVFDRTSGRLRDEPSVDAIFAARQITMLCGKVELPCSDTRVARAIDGYISCEQEVVEADSRRSDEDYRRFVRLSRLLWADTFQKVDEDIYYGRVMPKHGPGATADRLTGNRKYDQAEWTTRLEEIFPSWNYLVPNWHFNEVLSDINFLEPGEERPVRVVTVPKTLKTPRIIAIEPTCMQYMQQAICESLYDRIEDDSPYTFIGFRDQTPNQELALKGSIDGSLATLDLSEASDRVSNQLVRAMLRDYPNLFQAVDATRSRKADVPGNGVIRLAKFASMGSALCFPMEALVFSTLVFLGIEDVLNRPLTSEDLPSFEGLVRVYGDDMIVPVEYVSSVVARLEAFGFRVNRGKSFWTGKFRESCGKDYYDGHDITVVRMRQELPTHRSDAREIVATSALRNNFYWHGLWATASWLDSYMKRIIPFPVVEPASPALGRHSVLGHEVQRMSVPLQKPLVKAFRERSVIPDSDISDNGALMKFFLKRGESPAADVKHLERYGRPKHVDIQLGWVSAV